MKNRWRIRLKCQLILRYKIRNNTQYLQKKTISNHIQKKNKKICGDFEKINFVETFRSTKYA